MALVQFLLWIFWYVRALFKDRIGERHLTRILKRYFDYYHTARCHLSLDRNSPEPREVEPPEIGPVRSISMVGGLHHRYTRHA